MQIGFCAIAALQVSLLPIFMKCSMAQAPRAATAKAAAAAASIRSKNIDLTHVEPLIGLPPATVMGYPSYCSSDGTIFTQVYADTANNQVSNFPTVYSISELREVRRIPVAAPQGYKQVVLRTLFAASQKLALLIQASQPNDTSERLPAGQLASFMSISERDGGSQNIVKLNLGFLPVKAAIFDSGDFLILGLDTANTSPVLALVDSGGSLKQMLDLDSRNYTSSAELSDAFATRASDPKTSARREPIIGALNQAQFAPWGSQILLVQPGSQLPVLRIHDSGQIDITQISPPAGFLMGAVLGSDMKDDWVIVAKESSSFRKLSQGDVVENAPESLLEVDPFTGNVVARLTVSGPQVGEISCAAHGKLSATYYGLPEQPNVPSQLTYASAPR